jgi:hypothetical protein
MRPTTQRVISAGDVVANSLGRTPLVFHPLLSSHTQRVSRRFLLGFASGAVLECIKTTQDAGF